VTGILILDPEPEDWLQMQNWVWRIFLRRAQHGADAVVRDPDGYRVELIERGSG
jgi:hypothetical protein